MGEQVGAEPLLLNGVEVVAMPAHEREQTAVPAAGRVYVPPTGQELWLMMRMTWKRSATMRALGKNRRTKAR